MYPPTKCRMYVDDRNISNTKWQNKSQNDKTLMERVPVNAAGYSRNQPLRMVKYHWQTEGIKFIIITKQTFTEPSRDVTLEVSIKLSWHALVSPLFPPKTA